MIFSDLGMTAQGYMKEGKLVPDDLMVNLIASELASLKGNSWLLDGFPRTQPQAQALHKHQQVRKNKEHKDRTLMENGTGS